MQLECSFPSLSGLRSANMAHLPCSVKNKSALDACRHAESAQSYHHFQHILLLGSC